MATKDATTHLDDKVNIDHVNHVDETLSDHSKESLDSDPEFSPEEQKKIIHR